MDFTQERILSKFNYNPETGEITRKRSGKIIKSTDQDGYIVVSDFEYGRNDRMRGARLVWVMHNGDIPEGMVVDHKNRIRTDNRLDNLRLATVQQNAANATRKDDFYTSRYKGVQRDQWGRWLSTIWTGGTTRVLGQYDSEEAAAHAYNLAAQEAYGEFAVLNDVQPVNLEDHVTNINRRTISEARRGLPFNLGMLYDDFALRVDNKVLARFKSKDKDDAIACALHYNETGEILDFKTDVCRYNKFGLPFTIFPCSTGYRASFMKNRKERVHVGTFRTVEEAQAALFAKQEEVLGFRKEGKRTYWCRKVEDNG